MKTLLAAFTIWATQAAAQTLVIEHVRVFDGTRAIADTNVVVEGGVIRAVGASTPRPTGAEVIDGHGKTLLPGLIDAHTHTIGAETLAQAPVFGVTTDLDMFTDPKMAANVKKEQSEGKLLNYADLRSAGYLATSPGGHGTEYGIPVPTLTKPEEAQAWVDARIAEGSDYIKAVYDDSTEYGVPKPRPTLSKDVLKALADAAHKRGKMLVVHIGSLSQAMEAIEAGADGLVHLFVGAESRPDFGKVAAAHHIWVIPTLTVLQSICATSFDGELAGDARLRPYLPGDAFAMMTASFSLPAKISCAGANEAVKQLKAAGVPILAGTDAGNPGTTQGASEHGELELLVRAGLTPAEALRAATSAPAAAFHLDDRGAIAVGKRADLVLVNGDPTVDIRATRDIVAVWKVGQKIDREGWKTQVAKQAEEEAKAKSAPAPTGSESGWIADFEQAGAPQAKFGAGWMVTSDSMAGGKSAATMEAAGGMLRVTGEVKDGFAYPWAGAMFSPGTAPMQPANLSGFQAIVFRAKGDGQTYQVMLFSKKLGYRPATQNFVAGPEWKEITLPFRAFGDMDGSDIMAIAWVGGPKPGKFELEVDDVRLTHATAAAH